MTGDCGDVVTSLGAWALWAAGPVLAQAALDAAADAVWWAIGGEGPGPRIDLEAIL